MDLFQCGFGARPDTPAQVDGNHRAVSILRANKVKVLWLSWCDAVVAHQCDAASWTVEYRGTGLTSAQREFIANSHAVRDSISRGLCFFGSGMHEGLLGCVIFRNDRLSIANQVIIFATDLEIESGIPQVQLYTISNTHEVLGIKIASGGSILVNIRDLVTGESQILQLEDLQELQQRLKANSLVHTAQSPLGSFQPTQWCTNAITSTALDQSGKVYTSTCDSRYSKCLGRPYDGNPTFELVPYLSETVVSTVASGGYLTAALSSDGELFLWGQNCPGTSGDLSVLNKSMAGRDTHQIESPRTGIWAEGEQDDFVKCMTVYIDGEEACVYDVAVGHGHILVAAEVLSIKKRTVFSAGDNSEHQAGLQTEKASVAEFTELREFKDAHIQQVAAAGWSTLVLRKDDKPHNEYTQISS